MTKWGFLAALMGTLAVSATGCGSDEAAPAETARTSGAELLADELASFDEADVFRPRASVAELSELPTAPWEGAPLPDQAVPASVVDAWRAADNRGWCAPLSPSMLGVDAAEARVAEFEGGWAVEFDAMGHPGVNAAGDVCSSCGRSVFGIAGTGIQIDEDESTEGAPTYRDGSSAAVTPLEEGVASATIAIHGQSCVYQVWTFLGHGHLERLLDGLRFVVVTDSGADTQLAGVGYK